MFEPKTRRHPVQSFHFWFVLLLCFCGGLAWKLELLPELWSSPTLPVLTDEPMPPPPGQALSFLADQVATVEAAPQQTETPAERPQAEVDHAEGPSLSQRGVPDELPGAMETQPAPSPLVRTVSAVVAEMPRQIVQVKAETAEDIAPPEAQPETAPPEPTLDLTEVDRLLNAGNEIEAHRLLSHWYWSAPQSRRVIQDRMNFLARRIYFAPEPHYLAPYIVQFGEQLESIAAKHQLSAAYLAKLNRMDLRELRAGQTLKVVPGPFSGVIETTQNLLTLHSQGYFVAAFPCRAMDSADPAVMRLTVVEKGADPQGNPWIKIRDGEGAAIEFTMRSEGRETQDVSVQPLPGFQLPRREMTALCDMLLLNAEVIVKP